MSQPTQSDMNAPPGGGGNNVIASTQGRNPGQNPDPKEQQPNPNPVPKEQPQGTPPSNEPLLPDPAPEPKKEPENKPDATEVPDLGDPALNVAADYFVNTLGLSVDSPELAEAARGNYSYLEAKIVQMGDKAKGAERYVELARMGQQRVGESQKAAHEAAVKTVHEAVGGEENWKAVQTFAQSNLKPDQLSEARAALSQGGFAAEAMAKHLLALASGSDTTIVGSSAVNPDSAVTQSLAAHAPLTREQYRAEYRKLVDQYGINGVQKAPELEALNRRLIRKK